MNKIDKLLSENKEKLEHKLRVATMHCYSGIRLVKDIVFKDICYEVLVSNISYVGDFDCNNVDRLIKDTFELPDEKYSDEKVIYNELTQSFKKDFDIINMCVKSVISGLTNDKHHGKIYAYDFYAMGVLMYLVDCITQGKNLHFDSFDMYKKHSKDFKKIFDEELKKCKELGIDACFFKKGDGKHGEG